MRTSTLTVSQAVHQKLLWAADLMDMTPDQLLTLMVEHVLDDKFMFRTLGEKHGLIVKDATP